MKTYMSIFLICIPLLCSSPTYVASQSSCPAGSYQISTTAACLKCPIGTYQPYKQSSSCRNCPLGSYCPQVGAISHIQCPAGTYNPKTTMTSVNACLKCPIGTYQPDKQASSCRSCPIGYSCIDPAKTPVPLPNVGRWRYCDIQQKGLCKFDD